MAIEELIFKNWRINWHIYRPFGKIQFMNTNIDRIIGQNQIQSIQAKGKLEFDTNPYDVVRW